MRIISFLFFIIIQISIVQGQYFPSLHFDIDDGLPSSQVYDAWEDSLGYMWFTTDRGVSRFDGRNFVSYTSREGLACETNFRIYPASSNTFWVNGINGKFSFWDGFRFSSFKYNEFIANNLKLKSAAWNTIINYEDGVLSFFVDNNSFSCPNKYYQINLSGEIESKPFDNLSILGKHASNYIQYCFSKCFDQTNENNEILKRIKSKYPKMGEIISTYKDTKGNFWFGTYLGMYLYENSTNEVQLILENVSISTVYEKPGEGYWICTLNNGVYYIPNLQIKKLELRATNRMVNSLAVKSDTLFAKEEGGIIYKIEENSFKRYQVNLLTSIEDVKRRKNIFSTFRISDNREIRFSTSGFGFLINDSIPNLYPERSLCAVEATNNKVWVGTTNGLYYSDLTKTHPYFQKYTSGIDIENYRINDLEVCDNYLWLSTMSHGVILVSGDKVWPVEEQYQISMLTHSLFLQNDSTLWVATNKGLSKMSFTFADDVLTIKKTENYDRSSGLLSNYILDIELWKDQLFLATNHGVCYFYPDSIQSCNSKPTIFVSGIKANNKTIKNKSFVNYSENNIDIFFEGISFSRLPPNKEEFRYRLNNSPWIYIRENIVHFSELEPQKYTFEVQFRNLNSIWSDPVFVSFTINPPFVQTWWFKLLVFLVIILVVWYWIWRIYHKNKQKQKYQKIELTTLRSQINPHFIFNSLNTLQSFIFLDKKQKANEFLWNFSLLIRKGLEYSRKDLITMDEEIEYISTYCELEKQRFYDRFIYQVKSKGFANSENILLPPILVQPVVENAIKHAFKNKQTIGRITITYEPHDEITLCVTVSDDGVGFDQNLVPIKKHLSLGLSIIRERLSILNKKNKIASGRLVIESNVEKGTTVRIFIPYKIKREETL